MEVSIYGCVYCVIAWCLFVRATGLLGTAEGIECVQTIYQVRAKIQYCISTTCTCTCTNNESVSVKAAFQNTHSGFTLSPRRLGNSFIFNFILALRQQIK